MNYEVHFTRAAENDLNEAADYIEFVLLNPQAADDLLDTVEETLPTLAQYAQRYALVDDPVLRAWGIRFVQIKNYLSFYTISEEEQKEIYEGLYCAFSVRKAQLDQHSQEWLFYGMIGYRKVRYQGILKSKAHAYPLFHLKALGLALGYPFIRHCASSSFMKAASDIPQWSASCCRLSPAWR